MYEWMMYEQCLNGEEKHRKRPVNCCSSLHLNQWASSSHTLRAAERMTEKENGQKREMRSELKISYELGLPRCVGAGNCAWQHQCWSVRNRFLLSSQVLIWLFSYNIGSQQDVGINFKAFFNFFLFYDLYITTDLVDMNCHYYVERYKVSLKHLALLL